MLHPAMSIRPDDVMRSGIWQPFSVRAMSPVAFAQHEIDPFIRAIRPTGPTPGGVHMVNGALGQTTTTAKNLYWGLGGLAVGALLGFTVSRFL